MNIIRRKFLLVSAGIVLLSCFGMAKEALAEKKYTSLTIIKGLMSTKIIRNLLGTLLH